MEINHAHPENDSSHEEEEAFNYFFRQYYRSLCFFANSILHNEEEAKDLVQDCYVKLWKSQTIREKSGTMKSFLYTAVRNRCLDMLRKKKVKKKAEFELSKISTNLDFEYFDEVAFAELMRLIFGRIEDLPPQMQKVMKLYYLEGKKYKQIATELNKSPETIRKQKASALKLIRQKFLFLLSFF